MKQLHYRFNIIIIQNCEKNEYTKFDSSDLILTGKVDNFTNTEIRISLREGYFKDIKDDDVVKQRFDKSILNSFKILRCYIIDPNPHINTKFIEGVLTQFGNTSFIQSLIGNLRYPKNKIFEESDLICEKKLNEQQKKAVLNALNSQISVVFGPPGTGKTTLIKSMVLNFLYLEQQTHRISEMDEKVFHFKHNDLKNPKVLCVAQNNNAANAIVSKLRYCPIGVCRFISFERLEEMPFDEQWKLCIYNKTLEYALRNKDKFENYKGNDGHTFNLIGILLELEKAVKDKQIINYSRKKMGDIEYVIKKEFKNIIEDCSCIVATLRGCNKDEFHGINFLCTFIDEASQCTEFDCLFPVVLSPRLVLLGDIQQLKPVLLSKESKQAGFDITMLERLLRCDVRHTLLNEQYRMHPGFSILSNTLFYGGCIMDCTSSEQTNISIFPNKKRPIVFICHTGKERYCDGGKLFNDDEAQICKEVYELLCKEENTNPKIEFLTPYNSQKGYVKKHCGIERASTIDSFQGNESDYVIFSPVRSNYNKGAHFIGDYHRVNVAITRAKKGLIIVGNYNTLRYERVWQLIFNFLARKGCFMNYEKTKKNHFVPTSYPNFPKGDYENSPFITKYLEDNFD
ncbi:hypothetical protein, conserved [Entamoeba dispar SAW760]|uniref:Uncharacterized protein n=1 Tax=Entamoeba dispar (strain ATCC PRA-260 / SAW760) TaxID=370354 RepID=B0ECL2_ENTDS|nr:uncharacterized protein EDI_264640 [Entamoeba dispar SAW760]EDR27732.1 hypothetical protein, conserved [Entamoeba dispar SAW760]|eukprot:EDR27732.1 hypothetical protein, conserved [Entamoeba dispar SAW760]